MTKIAEFICKHRKLIVITSIILLILSFIGIKLTHVNYDVLLYLPEDIETIQGQNILTNDFKMGSYSIMVIPNKTNHDILEMESKIKEVDGVNKVVSLYDVLGTTIPIEALPNEITSKVHIKNTDILFITFAGSTSSERTLNAVSEIRKVAKDTMQGGMSSMVVDTKNLSEKEIFIYVAIAVLLCILILQVSLDSYIVPFILLINIGFAIIFNLGSNIFLGEISYITKALVAVLQLGVTTDFSIFLYHSYESQKTGKNNEKAMVKAIKDTFVSVTGSSLTTIAGFLVLCTMQLTLGRDLGIVMAKGVFLGVLTVLTLFPSLLLIFDKYVEKTKHKQLVPNFTKLNKGIIKHRRIIFILFLLLIVPAYLAYQKVDVYYKLDKSLPDTLESIKANEILKNDYHIVSPEMVLINRDIKNDDLLKLTKELESIDGIEFVLSTAKLDDLGLSNSLLSAQIQKLIRNDKYQLLLVNSIYETATDELNEQVDKLNKVVKKYDNDAIVAGEGPLMKDLVNICDIDFKNVNLSSILCIFIILFFVLKSFSLPFLLITAIEAAIFTNMSVSYFSGVTLPFIAPIVLGTIQLGATIDYAILLTTTYLKKRKEKLSKEDAMLETLNYCGISIFISGMCFFAATFGVGVYSQIEMIGALCTLIARGALISMLMVIMVLPSIILTFDKLIMVTTMKGSKKMKKLGLSILIVSLFLPTGALALEKNETVYGRLGTNGAVKNVLVSEHILNKDSADTLEDYSELEDILNVNDDRTFTKKNNKLIWTANGKDIFYQGKTDKELPIKVNISYKLNGKTMKLNDMISKNGNVTITLKYPNSDMHIINGETLYTPFIVTMGTIIDSENNKNIKVSNGKVITNGKSNIIIALSTPGLYESLNIDELVNMDTITINYDTTKFELASIYNVVTSKLISIDDLAIFDQVDSIYGQVNLLSENMNKIDDGAKKIAAGSNLLKSKLGESINSIENKNALTDEQVSVIKDKTVQATMSKLDETALEEIADTTWTAVKEQLDNSTDTTVSTYVSNAISTILSSDSTTTILATYLGSPANLAKYFSCINGDETACADLVTNNIDINTVNAFVTQLTTSMGTAASNTVYYIAENTSKSVSKSITKKTAESTAGSVSESLAPQVANEVKNASIDSLNTLYNGISELDEGINTLSSGISTFNNKGISKISSLANGKLKGLTSKLKSLVNLGNNYNSFVSGDLLNSGETKFILIIDSKKAKEETKATSKENKKDNFVDRITNLFN